MHKPASPAAEKMLETLKTRGYRSTGPRRAVVRAVVNQGRHFTAEELCQKLKDLGRATVFRSLKLLVEEGVLCRVLLEDGSLHYQLGQRDHHHHLLCAACGNSQDLPGCDIEDQLAAASARQGFKLSGHWLEVYGVCKNCLN